MFVLKKDVLSILFFLHIMVIPELNARISTPHQAVLILGMHRSGTSALTGFLHNLGLHVGSRLLAADAATNPKGFFENVWIVDRNVEVLQMFKSEWDDITPLDCSLATERGQKAVEIIKTALVHEFAGAFCFGFKDPRTCVLLPFYNEALRQLGWQVKYIIVQRNLLEIQDSLGARDNMPLPKSNALIKKHYDMIEAYATAGPRLYIHFHDLLNATASVIQRIEKFLPQLQPTVQKKLKAVRFLDKNLKHFNRREPV